MAVPTVLETYPADSDTGIPVGEQITIRFDRGIDLSIAKSMCVLYGRDYDITSGPDSARWINQNTDGANPLFLTSPGFTGVVPMTATVSYVDTVTGAASSFSPVTGESDETAEGIGHLLTLTPDESLAPDVEYTLIVYGDPDSTDDTGISSRTVFDVEADGGNTGSGELYAYGGYTGAADTVWVEVTTAGDIGTAKYKWWYASAGVVTAVLNRVTARRYRRLDDGLQINFKGSALALGDKWSFNVEPIERMAASYTVSFTTNDGSYSEAPDSPSTPVTATPPTSIIPGASAAGSLMVDYMIPADRSYNVSLSTDQIVIEFTSDLDATTVTDDTVEVWVMAASGFYDDTYAPYELSKSLTVSGSTLTIGI